jgi:hypothetical protein
VDTTPPEYLDHDRATGEPGEVGEPLFERFGVESAASGVEGLGGRDLYCGEPADEAGHRERSGKDVDSHPQTE